MSYTKHTQNYLRKMEFPSSLKPGQKLISNENITLRRMPKPKPNGQEYSVSFPIKNDVGAVVKKRLDFTNFESATQFFIEKERELLECGIVEPELDLLPIEKDAIKRFRCIVNDDGYSLLDCINDGILRAQSTYKSIGEIIGDDVNGIRSGLLLTNYDFNRIEPDTYKHDKTVYFRIKKYFGKHHPLDITAEEILKWLTKKHLLNPNHGKYDYFSQKSLSKYYQKFIIILKHGENFKELNRLEIQSKNVIKKGREKLIAEVYEPDEVEAIMIFVRENYPSYLAPLAFLFWGYCRQKDVCMLKWEDIHFYDQSIQSDQFANMKVAGEFTVLQSKKLARNIVITDQLKAWLDVCPKKSPYVFDHVSQNFKNEIKDFKSIKYKEKTTILQQVFSRQIRKILKTLEKERKLNALRHTCASMTVTYLGEQSATWVCAMLGNSHEMLERHYYVSKRKNIANKHFEILPK